MFTGTLTGGTAAVENHFMIMVPGNHPVPFKEFHRKERNFIKGFHTFGKYPQVVEIGFINGILSSLELKNLQCKLLKLLIITDAKDPVRGNLNHPVKLRKATAKSFPSYDIMGGYLVRGIKKVTYILRLMPQNSVAF